MTAVSTLGQSTDNVFRLNQLQAQLSDYQTQLATGKKTQRFKGLETDVVRSQRARADVNSLDTYMSNITNADRRIRLMLNSIEEFQAQAENFAASLDIFVREGKYQEGEVVYYDDPLTPENDRIAVGMSSGEPANELKVVQQQAESIFNLLTELINEKDGDRFLLAGAQSTTKPLVNSGLLTAATTSLIDDWKNGSLSSTAVNNAVNTKDTSVSARAITDSIVGYAPELSSGNAKGVSVRVDDFSELDYTVLANSDGFRDILVALDFIRNESFAPVLDEVDPNDPLVIITQGAPGADINAQQENFFAVFENIQKMVTTALDAIDTERFKLEQVRATIFQVKEDHTLSKNTLLDAISTIEDADMNEIALKVNFLQIQLEASYRVTASISNLTLVNFI